ncbi:MAG TPA: class I SAM-dependent methyltransferase [Acetobacteraceae bacterium]|nr:class I SAM-dependent methyltransferase [Acetobacteraceae bacterium]
MTEPDWRSINRAHWDEKVALHVGPRGYDLLDVRAGHGLLNAIEEAELGSVDGLRILHLQCHFGRDTLILAQRGATVVGLDFSAPAIDVARGLAAELGLADRARFVRADLYDAREAIPEQASFDRVFVTWGAIIWLPDIARWAEVVAHFLKPGGALYLAEVHPAALVFDDAAALPDGRPGFCAPYFSRAGVVMQEAHDYIDETATVANATTHTWIHPLGAIVTGLIEAGLRLDWLHEHDAITWHMFEQLVEGGDGQWRWPDKPWLPLAFSLQATRC